ncbi:hypothetical protein [Chitinophaga sp. HK235]|uniref:hypothetical protein n=1 Tax=Chitinophaga sp. HK235 TaxID=2952571 RepID=UPI001BAA20D0|nr:hypothetical protein [Chitinophaga sp. HK235]
MKIISSVRKTIWITQKIFPASALFNAGDNPLFDGYSMSLFFNQTARLYEGNSDAR